MRNRAPRVSRECLEEGPSQNCLRQSSLAYVEAASLRRVVTAGRRTPPSSLSIMAISCTPILSTSPTTSALPMQKYRNLSGIPVFVQSSGNRFNRSTSTGVRTRRVFVSGSSTDMLEPAWAQAPLVGENRPRRSIQRIRKRERTFSVVVLETSRCFSALRFRSLKIPPLRNVRFGNEEPSVHSTL